MICLFFVFSFHVCITQAYTLSASLTLISVASTYASPVQDKKQQHACFHAMFLLASSVLYVGQQRTEQTAEMGLPCLCHCCYSYTELINVFSLCWLRYQSLEQQSRLSRQSVWRLSRRGKGREKQNQTDVCSDSETSVFSTVAHKTVNSKFTPECFFLAAWRAHDEFSPSTQCQTNSKQHVHFIPDGSASYYRHKLYFVFKGYLTSYWLFLRKCLNVTKW